ncbi:hypothetical protein ACFLSQ_10480 [Bacteroidota bacterium]
MSEISLSKPYNINIVKVLRLTREMIILADEGDDNRKDSSCGVLYGLLRDTAYKIRGLAEKEIPLFYSYFVIAKIFLTFKSNVSSSTGLSK